MWSTENGRYCYLIGIEIHDINKAPLGTCCKCIANTNYAVAYVPSNISAVDAWTEYYEKILPEHGYVPNASHGIDFEYYPNGTNGNYELWTPVTKEH